MNSVFNSTLNTVHYAQLINDLGMKIADDLHSEVNMLVWHSSTNQHVHFNEEVLTALASCDSYLSVCVSTLTFLAISLCAFRDGTHSLHRCYHLLTLCLDGTLFISKSVFY